MNIADEAGDEVTEALATVDAAAGRLFALENPFGADWSSKRVTYAQRAEYRLRAASILAEPHVTHACPTCGDVHFHAVADVLGDLAALGAARGVQS